MPRPRPVPTVLACLALTALLAASTAAADSDLDGDGTDDLVVGLPDESVGGVASAGVVNILRGGGNGVRVGGDKLFSQADLGSTVEEIDRFGNAIAYGDFDNDGFDDVAVGAPGEDWNGAQNAGVVHVIYGSGRGANKRDTQILSQAGPMAGKNEDGDFFGAVLAAGDLNGDGFDDLVISVPGEDISGKVAAGAIMVAFGSSRGIRTGKRGSKMISQKGKVPGAAELTDAFGFALAVGDFNDDGFDDIAIGTPGEDLGGALDAGVVTVLYGRSTGVDKQGDAFKHSSLGRSDDPEDQFGSSLAAGDFDNDGDDDLAIGIRGEDVGGVVDAGAVAVLLGGAGGLSTAGAEYITRGGPLGTPEAGDEFGFVMAAGDYRAGPADDLAVGMPDDDVAGNANSGSVVIIQGTAAGALEPGLGRVLSQGSVGAAEEAGDRFGETLRTGDFNGDGNDDLAIGSPAEDVAGRVDLGIVYVLYGDGNELAVANHDRFHQRKKGVRGTGEAGDRFGTGL